MVRSRAAAFSALSLLLALAIAADDQDKEPKYTTLGKLARFGSTPDPSVRRVTVVSCYTSPTTPWALSSVTVRLHKSPPTTSATASPSVPAIPAGTAATEIVIFPAQISLPGTPPASQPLYQGPINGSYIQLNVLVMTPTVYVGLELSEAEADAAYVRISGEREVPDPESFPRQRGFSYVRHESWRPLPGVWSPEFVVVNADKRYPGFSSPPDIEEEVILAWRGWTCPPAHYNDGRVCHCMCGLPDPDCMYGKFVKVVGCGTKGNVRCSAGGELCVNVNWTNCDIRGYGADDGCDCGCGGNALDADCLFPDSRIAPGSCSQFVVPGCELKEGGACSDQWKCPRESWNDSKLCNLLCGTEDPDCVTTGTSLPLPKCGNGIKEPGEECEGPMTACNAKTCACEQGFALYGGNCKPVKPAVSSDHGTRFRKETIALSASIAAGLVILLIAGSLLVFVYIRSRRRGNTMATDATLTALANGSTPSRVPTALVMNARSPEPHVHPSPEANSPTPGAVLLPADSPLLLRMTASQKLSLMAIQERRASASSQNQQRSSQGTIRHSGNTPVELRRTKLMESRAPYIVPAPPHPPPPPLPTATLAQPTLPATPGSYAMPHTRTNSAASPDKFDDRECCQLGPPKHGGIWD